MIRPAKWDLYQSLFAVLEAGSLSGAARMLGLSQPTLGRHIEQLEQALGLPLFTRSPQGLKPTDLALSVRTHLEAMNAASDAIVRDASGEAEGETGVVRITASNIIGAEVLPPILADFRDQHPGIAVELALSNAVEDLLRREADIAVRMRRPTQAALLAKRIGAVDIGLYAHRRFIEKHGIPNGLGSPSASAIGPDRDETALRSLDELSLPFGREGFAFRSDNDLAQLAAVRAGFGVGGIQTGIARRDPDLVRVLAAQFSHPLEIWLVMHEDLKTSRRVRLMFDALADGLAGYVAYAKG